MDWAEELRTFRRRTNLKQEAVANQLRVSQAYISRLESGHVAPSDEMRRRLYTLFHRREHRPNFDYWLATVHHSPACVAIMALSDEGIRIEAISEGFRNAGPPFDNYSRGDILGSDLGVAPRSELDRLVERGLFSGAVECIKCPWWAEHAGCRIYWLGVHVPVRDETGAWYAHVHNIPFSAQDYDNWRRANGDTMVVIPFNE